ncbi:MAG: flippase-like domain-containing protein [Lachnospiraceae bacterium]|nr:flippase-like domain-containing protein [Lachnospiraceae bacterium]
MDNAIEKTDKNKNENKKRVVWTLISIVMAVLTIRAVLASGGDISGRELWETLKEAHKPYLALAFLMGALFVWFEAAALWAILKKTGSYVPMKKALIYSTSDIYFSAITPSASGGQPASAYFMYRDGIYMAMVTAALMLNLMMYNLSVVFLGFGTLILCPGALSGFGETSKCFIYLGFVVLSLLGLAFYLMLKKGGTVFSLASRLVGFLGDKKLIKKADALKEKIKKTGDDYAGCSKLMAGNKGLALTAFFWNLLQRSSQIAIPAFVFMAIGGDGRTAAELFARQCYITIGSNYVPVPGAMGIADYLMIDGFDGIMGSNTAVRLEMLSRSVSFYICVAVSGLITLAAYLSGRKKNAGSL